MNWSKIFFYPLSNLDLLPCEFHFILISLQKDHFIRKTINLQWFICLIPLCSEFSHTLFKNIEPEMYKTVIIPVLYECNTCCLTLRDEQFLLRTRACIQSIIWVPHKKTLLGDINAKVEREEIFTLRAGNESLHETRNANWVSLLCQQV
jgi:hypothetical protein